MSEQQFRVEHDSMGDVRLPVWARWQAQTQRAAENFPISGYHLDRAHIAALGHIKAVAARVNAELGVIDPVMADAIEKSALAVAAGEYDDHFPVDVFQTGSGTSSNMNANEVIATLAQERLGKPVHPNDHVNASQSSNDVFPSSIHITATGLVCDELIPALRRLEGAFNRKVVEFAPVVKAGRTHLMDATPVTLAQEFGGYATQVKYGVERLNAVLPRLGELPLGGTAVGTGVNAPPRFAELVIAELARTLKLPLKEARNHFEAQGARDALVETSGALRTIATGLHKIANDLRLMNSGPRAGLAEIRLPELQPGSSIMPGKVNPVIPEVVCQARNLIESIRLLTNVSRVFADRCVDGIEADVARCQEYAESSPSIVTPLTRYIGYEEAASVAKEALKERRTIRDVVLGRGYVEKGRMTVEQLDAALDVLAMTRPAAD
jgi:fumarate hydratase class II